MSLLIRIAAMGLMMSVLLAVGCDGGRLTPRSSNSPASTMPANATVTTSTDTGGANVERAVVLENSPDTLPVWDVAEEDLALLGPPFSFPPYEIRPPASVTYRLYDSKTFTHLWAGPVNSDGDTPQFLVTVLPLTLEESKGTLGSVLNKFLTATQRFHASWEQDDFEYGLIHGAPFVRTSFRGDVIDTKNSGLPARRVNEGLVYGTRHSNQYIQIVCRGVTPDRENWFKLTTLAAKTFRILPPSGTSQPDVPQSNRP